MVCLYIHTETKHHSWYLAIHIQNNVPQTVAFNKAPQTIIPHTHSKQSTTGDNSLYTHSKQGTTDWQQGLTKHHRSYVKLCWYFFIQAFMLKWVISKYKIHMTIIVILVKNHNMNTNVLSIPYNIYTFRIMLESLFI